MIRNDKNNSILTVVYDTQLNPEDRYISKIENIMKNIDRIQKGINYDQNQSMVEINNKYYECSIELKLLSSTSIRGEKLQSDGLIIYGHSEFVRKEVKIKFLIRKIELFENTR